MLDTLLGDNSSAPVFGVAASKLLRDKDSNMQPFLIAEEQLWAAIGGSNHYCAF